MKILFLEVPCLHLGYLGFYGNDWIATPNLDRLASTGVVFDRHFAGGSDDLFTGCCRLPLPGASRTAVDLSSLLRHFGAIDVKVMQIKKTDFAQEIGGHIETSAGPTLIWAQFPSLAPPWEFSADALAMYFEEDAAEDGPWPDPHMGFLTGARDVDLERLRNTYAAVVTLLDAQLGDLLANRDLESWVVCLTSGQGLPLGEHGYVGPHRAWQHEELVHLPLLLRLPNAEQAGLRIAALTQPADIVPTLLDLFQLPGGELQGHSLMPLIREEATAVRPYACSGACVGESCEWSLRTRDWALLLPLATPPGDPPRGPRLYVKPDDRWEVNDVAHHHLERVERLEKALRAFPTIDPEVPHAD